MPRLSLWQKLAMVFILTTLFIMSAYSQSFQPDSIILPKVEMSASDTNLNSLINQPGRIKVLTFQNGELRNIDNPQDLLCQNSAAKQTPGEKKELKEALPLKTNENKKSDKFIQTKSPKVIYQVAPIYPESYRIEGWEASVMMEVKINQDGTVKTAIPKHLVMNKQENGKQIMKANAEKMKTDKFSLAAVEAIKQWRFEASNPMTVNIPIKFKLSEKK